ncbi:hypothetical protein KIN20_029736 [Parelaphostrongylus tenuis]|uniref:Uncharacterized protein n=1 Tax=Parelaphostrongylus tenuis TaxID=148309 RepID=A0AAD5R3R6_PARTN|nr:hypothetical protein KIN20_029736 [Parelaphostrongylus tenuis]
MRSFYDILQVSPSASSEEVKRGYFSYLRRIHPDKTGNPEDREAITFATYIWSILKSPEKRREYDSWLREQHYRETKGTIIERLEVSSEDPAPIVEFCRCGDNYEITSEDIQKVVDRGIFECGSCSLCLEVVKTNASAT